MTQQNDSGGTARPVADMPPPPFDRLIETHGAAAATYRRLTWLLAIAGAAMLAIGLMTGAFWLADLGLVVALTAMISWKKAAEHAERADGVAVLRDEWAELAPVGSARRLRAILLDLYGAGAGHDVTANPA